MLTIWLTNWITKKLNNQLNDFYWLNYTNHCTYHFDSSFIDDCKCTMTNQVFWSILVYSDRFHLDEYITIYKNKESLQLPYVVVKKVDFTNLTEKRFVCMHNIMSSFCHTALMYFLVTHWTWNSMFALMLLHCRILDIWFVI